MINHLVLIRLKATTVEAQRAQLLKDIDVLRAHDLADRFVFGPDAGIGTGNNADVGLAATFANQAALTNYLQHPAHIEVVTKLRDLADDLNVIQFHS